MWKRAQEDWGSAARVPCTRTHKCLAQLVTDSRAGPRVTVSAAGTVISKLLLCPARRRSISGTQSGLCHLLWAQGLVLFVLDHGGLHSPSLGLRVAQWQKLA